MPTIAFYSEPRHTLLFSHPAHQQLMSATKHCLRAPVPTFPHALMQNLSPMDIGTSKSSLKVNVTEENPSTNNYGTYNKHQTVPSL